MAAPIRPPSRRSLAVDSLAIPFMPTHRASRLPSNVEPEVSRARTRTAPPSSPSPFSPKGEGEPISTRALDPILEFELPPALEASSPPEARGLARDAVRLMVSRYGDDAVTHTRFTALPEHLRAGDVLVRLDSARAELQVCRQAVVRRNLAEARRSCELSLSKTLKARNALDMGDSWVE